MKRVLKTIVALTAVCALMLTMSVSTFAAAPTYATKTVYNADGSVTVTLSNFGGVDAGETLAIEAYNSSKGIVWVDQVKAEDLGDSYSFTMTATQAASTDKLVVSVGDDNEGLGRTAIIHGEHTVRLFAEAGYVLPANATVDPVNGEWISTTADSEYVSFYCYPLAGHEVDYLTVDGTVVRDIVITKDNMITVPVSGDCDITVEFASIADVSPVVVEGSAADKALKISQTPAGNTWAEFSLTDTGITAGTVDEYTLDFRFKLPSLTYGAVGNRAFCVRNGNNDFLFLKDGDNWDFFLGKNGGGEAGDTDSAIYLGTAPMSDWQDVSLRVYKSGSTALTDVTLNGVSIKGLEMNFDGVTAPTLIQKYFGVGNIYGGNGNYQATYDFYLDHVNLTYDGSAASLCDEFDTATVSGTTATLKGTKTYTQWSAFTGLALVDGTGVSAANGFASGRANTIKSTNPSATYDGIDVLARIGYGTADNFGIIMGVKPLTGELTMEDLDNYDATNAADKDTVYTAFRGFAAGTDGRFGVQVVDSAASNSYFSGGLKVYVYVYAANSQTGEVVYKAVNADGFTFN